MRVLFVNWVDWRDAQARGGGVAVYQRNLARALEGGGIAAGWLSSGLGHDLARGAAPRWQAVPGQPGHYRIVNSAVLAPGQLAWDSPAQLADAATEAAFAAFMAATGPWDAVQFDNIEGLPVSVLGVARAAGARVVVVLHNYYPLCPQVNLWHRERESCPGFDQGRACVTCLPGSQSGHGARRAALAVVWQAERLGGPWLVPLAVAGLKAARAGLGLWRRLRGRGAAVQAAAGPDPEAAARFAARRAGMVAAINAQADAVLCVSDRVRVLAAAHGLDPALLRTARIGTPEAARFDRTAPRPSLMDAGGCVRLAYLGYMRRDKGFFFLLDALEALPAATAARLHLTVAARRGPPAAMARLAALRPRLAGLVHVDGYSHAELDGLLRQVTLGVVPVLWEDNLPQVALEMHLRGIPLLTSDLGGARELGDCPGLVFPAGDTAAFAARLAAVLEGRIDLPAYWSRARAPETMASHLALLRQVWSGGA